MLALKLLLGGRYQLVGAFIFLVFVIFKTYEYINMYIISLVLIWYNSDNREVSAVRSICRRTLKTLRTLYALRILYHYVLTFIARPINRSRTTLKSTPLVVNVETSVIYSGIPTVFHLECRFTSGF